MQRRRPLRPKGTNKQKVAEFFKEHRKRLKGPFEVEEEDTVNHSFTARLILPGSLDSFRRR